MNKKLICFDLDDTLIYSDKAHIIAYNEALKRFKLKLKKPKFLVTLFGMPHTRLIELIAPNIDKNKMDDISRLHDQFLVNRTYKYARQIPGIVKTLELLKKNYDLAVLSNSSHKNVLALLKGAEIDSKLFKFIIGNDDVKHGKPWPDEIFKAEKLEDSKVDFMVGDSIYDMIAGKKARVKNIGVLTGHTSGILLRKQGADYIVDSVKEIPKLLKEINNK
ncbi:MAG: HAD family hydrolase [Nanoarchaeota archaeon]